MPEPAFTLPGIRVHLPRNRCSRSPESVFTMLWNGCSPSAGICVHDAPEYAWWAWFGRGRCHQRRARRAEEASFSAFVSNPDFRVPRLRQIGWRAADRAVRRRKRGHPRDQNRGRGYRGVAALARSGPVAAQASFMSIFAQDLDPGLRPGSVVSRFWTVFLCATGEPESPAATSPSQSIGVTSFE